MIIDHYNLRIFLTSKTLSCKKVRWWKKLSGLDLVIEYHSSRKNLADKPSHHPDYVVLDNNSEQTFHTVEYVTRSSVKADKTVQKNGKVRQTLLAPEATSKPNHISEGQLAKTKNL